jgi:hypothetical protein
MKRLKGYKSDVLSAAACTVAVALITIIIIKYEPKSDSSDIIMSVIVMALMLQAIYFWVRATKKYIDITIEEKLNQKRESVSSSNENLSDA